MFRSETRIRIRYAETDSMGFAYYGYYAMYYEVARVESLRQLGMTYRQMEDMGTMMPVLENNSKFISPARYDDEIKVVTIIRNKPSVRIHFEYDIFNTEERLIHQGDTLLAFVNKQTGKPTRPPEMFMKLIEPFFK